MKKIFKIMLLSGLLISITFCNRGEDRYMKYMVNRINDNITVDANWDKPQWQKVKAITLKNYMGEKPLFWPNTQIKMLYNDNAIYVIFKVEDRYVKAVAKHINDKIYRDSCVEFFFTPGNNISQGYFNLEVNCGGMPYFGFQKGFKKDVVKIDIADIKKIKIAHSLPQTIEQEIQEPITWTVEYKIPIKMLEKYTEVAIPQSDVCWRANFYKTADATSNPHYITWNKVNNQTPNFHLPRFFGELIFK